MCEFAPMRARAQVCRSTERVEKMEFTNGKYGTSLQWRQVMMSIRCNDSSEV
jgi:hypothetical protein